MIRTIGLLLILPATLLAQNEEPPLRGRPDGYSHIMAVSTLQFEVTVAPVVVALEDPVTVRAIISGAVAKGYAPQRSQLRLFPDELEQDFYVEPVPTEDRLEPARNRWEFVYRLRPKRLDVVFPDMVLTYYSARNRAYKKARPDDSLSITVTPRSEKNLDHDRPRFIPEEFHDSAEPSAFALFDAAWLWWGALVVPVLCLGAHWIFPPPLSTDNVRRRHQLAAAAVARLKRGSQDNSELMHAVTDYLRLRLGFASNEATPNEVADFLKRLGIPSQLRQRVSDLYRNWDRVRYAPGATRQCWAPNAIELIDALEADPCVARRYS